MFYRSCGIDFEEFLRQLRHGPPIGHPGEKPHRGVIRPQGQIKSGLTAHLVQHHFQYQPVDNSLDRLQRLGGQPADPGNPLQRGQAAGPVVAQLHDRDHRLQGKDLGSRLDPGWIRRILPRCAGGLQFFPAPGASGVGVCHHRNHPFRGAVHRGIESLGPTLGDRQIVRIIPWSQLAEPTNRVAKCFGNRGTVPFRMTQEYSHLPCSGRVLLKAGRHSAGSHLENTAP